MTKEFPGTLTLWKHVVNSLVWIWCYSVSIIKEQKKKSLRKHLVSKHNFLGFFLSAGAKEKVEIIQRVQTDEHISRLWLKWLKLLTCLILYWTTQDHLRVQVQVRSLVWLWIRSWKTGGGRRGAAFTRFLIKRALFQGHFLLKCFQWLRVHILYVLPMTGLKAGSAEFYHHRRRGFKNSLMLETKWAKLSRGHSKERKPFPSAAPAGRLGLDQNIGLSTPTVHCICGILLPQTSRSIHKLYS